MTVFFSDLENFSTHAEQMAPNELLGQLSTYFVGRTAFYRLRQQIEREQSANFNLGRFHESVLDQGTPPVKYLPELVRARLAKSTNTSSP